MKAYEECESDDERVEWMERIIVWAMHRKRLRSDLWVILHEIRRNAIQIGKELADVHQND